MIAKVANKLATLIDASRWGNKQPFLGLEVLTRAFNRVRRELSSMGILFDGSRLDGVECYLACLPRNVFNREEWGCYLAQGFCDCGVIFVPNVDFAAFNGGRRILADVLRHEFGHALVDLYGKSLGEDFTVLFAKAFGGPYGARLRPKKEQASWEGKYVSAYAATATREDFAETFMLFMKHKGKMPARFCGKRAVEMKWNAVAKIVKSIAAIEGGKAFAEHIGKC